MVAWFFDEGPMLSICLKMQFAWLYSSIKETTLLDQTPSSPDRHRTLKSPHLIGLNKQIYRVSTRKSKCGNLKGAFSKSSGDYIVVPNFCLLSLRLQILTTCLFFEFLWLCKVSERFDNFYIRHFTMVPPLNFWWITKTKNIKGGTIVKCLI